MAKVKKQNKKAEDAVDAGGKKVELTDQQVAQIYEGARNAFESLNKRKNELLGAKTELERALLAVDDVSNSGKGEKIMVSIGAGVFLDAQIAEHEGFRLNIPGGIFKKANAAAVKAELGKRREDVNKSISDVDKELEKAVKDVNKWGKVMRDVTTAQRQAMTRNRPA